VALLLAGIALIVGSVALFRDPLGGSMAKYDFSNPKAALLSQYKMELNRDVRAMMDFSFRIKSSALREAIGSLEVRKEAEFQGKKILFIGFKKNGVNKYETKAFEKDAETGLWAPTYVSSFTVAKDDPQLAKQMEKWEKDEEPVR
jgi:hypothetical protein